MIIFQYLKPGNLPERIDIKDTAAVQREVILQRVLNILLALYSAGLPLVLVIWPEVLRSGQLASYLLAFLGLAVITFARAAGYQLRAGILVAGLQGLGTLALATYGLSGVGAIFLFSAAVLATLLLPQKTGRWLAYLSLVLLGLMGFLMVARYAVLPPVEVQGSAGSASHWMITGLVFLLLSSLVMGSIYTIFEAMHASLRAQKGLTLELEQAQALLGQRVEERSADLMRRISQFEIASEIAREILGETNLERLLSAAVNLIRDRFGFYHVGIFIADSRGEYAILRAATGEAGRAMLERSHRLKVSEVSIVGNVIKRGEARIAAAISNDLALFQNPLLPQTRSEMALPLRRGVNTIGALNVHSTEEQAFSQEDVRILQIIADQMAIAYEKTLLEEELNRSIQELDANYRATTLKSWRSYLKSSRQRTGYRYRNARLEGTVRDSDQAKQALQTGQVVLRTGLDGSLGQPGVVLAVPIKMRNQVLGVVDIQFASASVSPDLIALIQSTVDRLAISLENARLLEEIQQRAERERLVSEVSTRIRAASDVDSVLQIAIQEIGKSLGVSEVVVQLRKDE